MFGLGVKNIKLDKGEYYLKGLLGIVPLGCCLSFALGGCWYQLY